MENEVLALISSFIALAFVVCSYFVSKKNYLLFQSLCIVFLILSYFFNMQYFAMIGLCIGLFRALIFYFYERKDKRASVWWAVLISLMTIASYIVVNLVILKDAKPLDILCLLALVAYAFIFRIRNIKIVRYLMIIPTLLSASFNILTFAPIFATLTYAFEFSADIVSIFKFHVLPKRKKVAKV